MHKDYQYYTEDDFIADPYFQQWLNHHDEACNAYWEKVLLAYPQKKSAIMGARSFLEHLQIKTTLPTVYQTEASLLKSLQKIAAQEAEAAIEPQFPRRKHIALAAAGFVVAFILLAVALLQQSSAVTIEMVAGPKEIKTIILPDSSVVTLNSQAHLTYASGMMQSGVREVWLDGEAFFDVKHIHGVAGAKPFIVHSGDMDIEVLGTTFNVKKSGRFTNVSLNTGKIKIALKNHPGTSIHLQPGDLVRYSSNEKHIVRKQVKPELYSVWKEEKIVLDGMSLKEIARLLEDSYGYTTVIKDQQLADARVSGTLVTRDEAALLEALAFTLTIDIIKTDSTLIFQQKTKN